MNKLQFGKILEQLRIRKGLTRFQVAQSICASPALIKRWEQSEHCPQLYFVVQLADLFDVSIDELVGRERK